MWSIVIVNILIFLSASSQSWSSPALSKLMSNSTSPLGRAIDQNEAAWVASSLTLGCAVGTWIYSYLASAIGRKKMFLAVGVVFLASNLMIAFGDSLAIYYVARVIAGFSVTGIMFLLPVYIGELGHKSKRTFFISLATVVSCIGLLFPNAVGPFVSIYVMNLVLVGVSVGFLIIYSIFGKETPHYYLAANKQILAEELLMEIKKDPQCVKEALLEMQTVSKMQITNIRDIYRSKAFRKSFFIVNGFLIFQQLSGFDITLYYGLQLFQNFHSGITPEISIVIFDIFHLSGGFLVLVIGSKYPRKNLLIISGLGMGTSQTCLVLYTYIQKFYDFPKSLNVLPLVFLLCYIFMFNIGFGPFPFLMLGEIIPANVKFLIIPIAGSIYWMVAFVLTRNFYNLLNLIGLQGYFLFCTFCCCLGALFAQYYIIETKDKTLEEIQLELEGKE